MRFTFRKFPPPAPRPKRELRGSHVVTQYHEHHPGEKTWILLKNVSIHEGDDRHCVPRLYGYDKKRKQRIYYQWLMLMSRSVIVPQKNFGPWDEPLYALRINRKWLAAYPVIEEGLKTWLTDFADLKGRINW